MPAIKELETALRRYEQEGMTKAVFGALKRAADGLYQSDSPQALPLLKAAYLRDWPDAALANWTRARLFRSLLSLDRPESKLLVFEATEDSFWRIRMLAARELADHRDAAPELIRLTRDPHWRVREAACRSLGRQSGSEQVMDALQTAMNDPDDRVIACAETAFERLRQG